MKVSKKEVWLSVFGATYVSSATEGYSERGACQTAHYCASEAVSALGKYLAEMSGKEDDFEVVELVE